MSVSVIFINHMPSARNAARVILDTL